VSDLTIETAPVCATVLLFETTIVSSRTGEQYRVSFGPVESGPVQNDWSCTCKGWIYNRRCKHVDGAKLLRCGWNHELEPRPMPEGRVCPDCGGPLGFLRVGI